jgi:hypothetical protein
MKAGTSDTFQLLLFSKAPVVSFADLVIMLTIVPIAEYLHLSKLDDKKASKHLSYDS